MKLYIFILLAIFSISRCIEFNPELQQNILNFGYGINYKYEGMLTHSFDRFYIITKFILPSIGDIKFSNLTFDDSCSYMSKEYTPNTDASKFLKELKRYCTKIKPIVSYYSKLIKSYNNTVQDLLENKIKPFLPTKPRQKRGLITTLISGIIGLAYEGISSFLQRKRDSALKRAVSAMSNEVNTQCNKLFNLKIACSCTAYIMLKHWKNLSIPFTIFTIQQPPMRNYLQGNIILPYSDSRTRPA